MTDMKKSVIELMEEFIHEATPESILNDCRNFGIELDNVTSTSPKKVKEFTSKEVGEYLKNDSSISLETKIYIVLQLDNGNYIRKNNCRQVGPSQSN